MELMVEVTFENYGSNEPFIVENSKTRRHFLSSAEICLYFTRFLYNLLRDSLFRGYLPVRSTYPCVMSYWTGI